MTQLEYLYYICKYLPVSGWYYLFFSFSWTGFKKVRDKNINVISQLGILFCFRAAIFKIERSSPPSWAKSLMNQDYSSFFV